MPTILKEVTELESQAVSKYLKHKLSHIQTCIMSGYAVIIKEEVSKSVVLATMAGKGVPTKLSARGRESISRRPKNYFVIGENAQTATHFSRLLLLLSNEQV